MAADADGSGVARLQPPAEVGHGPNGRPGAVRHRGRPCTYIQLPFFSLSWVPWLARASPQPLSQSDDSALLHLGPWGLSSAGVAGLHRHVMLHPADGAHPDLNSQPIPDPDGRLQGNFGIFNVLTVVLSLPLLDPDHSTSAFCTSPRGKADAPEGT